MSICVTSKLPVRSPTVQDWAVRRPPGWSWRVETRQEASGAFCTISGYSIVGALQNWPYIASLAHCSSADASWSCHLWEATWYWLLANAIYSSVYGDVHASLVLSQRDQQSTKYLLVRDSRFFYSIRWWWKVSFSVYLTYLRRSPLMYSIFKSVAWLKVRLRLLWWLMSYSGKGEDIENKYGIRVWE